MNYNKLIPGLRSSRKKPYPVYRYNFKSDKYDYVYNESLDDITYWHGRLEGLTYYITKRGTVGLTSWNYYSDSEEKCAKEVYKMINKNLKRITRQNKSHDNGHYRRHINWQEWVANYELINQ